MLRGIKLSTLEPCDACFLTIEHEGQEYVGALLLGDPLFCCQIFTLLTEHNGESIQQIGDIDLSDSV